MAGTGHESQHPSSPTKNNRAGNTSHTAPTTASDSSKLEKARRMAPLRPSDYQASQDVIRRVYDPLSGRTRLVKGTGEILEEMVTRDRHMEINKLSTKGDGTSYSHLLFKEAMKE
jgi:hypothetical protein